MAWRRCVSGYTLGMASTGSHGIAWYAHMMPDHNVHTFLSANIVVVSSPNVQRQLSSTKEAGCSKSSSYNKHEEAVSPLGRTLPSLHCLPQAGTIAGHSKTYPPSSESTTFKARQP